LRSGFFSFVIEAPRSHRRLLRHRQLSQEIQAGRGRLIDESLALRVHAFGGCSRTTHDSVSKPAASSKSAATVSPTKSFPRVLT
jgi:hypothetical protein